MGEIVSAHNLSDLVAAPLPDGHWCLERRVYAAAHDVEPHQVEETDGGYQDVCQVIADDEAELVRVLSERLAIRDDEIDWPDIWARIDALRRLAERLVNLDNPLDPVAVADRRTVTLTDLINQAKAALGVQEGDSSG